eukprot:CAMPEP_0197622954 /NCGR_PEP_ID=MMETSP1338-20131121/3058_1 /TAXON_ID=43686 ORGANISM="Pelagodinium beii, Strain RCC1491" /NCGR_SAMPLE_ID=MMETSP1338 /ASSEMBLY_ACC=CAM_ASM_000754 /LENGTH=677 /DNA_ID=CAMNT_0043192759 /DNA_START=50 /DNA_END=2083 /DNA_ORIENTATION=+
MRSRTVSPWPGDRKAVTVRLPAWAAGQAMLPVASAPLPVTGQMPMSQGLGASLGTWPVRQPPMPMSMASTPSLRSTWQASYPLPAPPIPRLQLPGSLQASQKIVQARQVLGNRQEATHDVSRSTTPPASAIRSGSAPARSMVAKKVPAVPVTSMISALSGSERGRALTRAFPPNLIGSNTRSGLAQAEGLAQPSQRTVVRSQTTGRVHAANPHRAPQPVVVVRSQSLQPHLQTRTGSLSARAEGHGPRIVRPGAITVPAPSQFARAPALASQRGAEVLGWTPLISVGTAVPPLLSTAKCQQLAAAAAAIAGQEYLALSEPTTARTLCPQIPSLPASASAPPAGPSLGCGIPTLIDTAAVLSGIPEAAQTCAPATVSAGTSAPIAHSAALPDTIAAKQPEDSGLSNPETERPPMASGAPDGGKVSNGADEGKAELQPSPSTAIASTPQKPEESTGHPSNGQPVRTAVPPVAMEAVTSRVSLADAVAAAGMPGNGSTPTSPKAWQVSPVLPAEAKSMPTSASPMVHMAMAMREPWDRSPGGSGTPRKSLVYSQTPSSGTVTISSVATPLRSPSSCCSPAKLLTSMVSDGQGSVVIGAAPTASVSSPAARRRRSSPPEGSRTAETWHQLYLREVGRNPATAEQLRAFVLHRGGHLPWVVARRIVPANEIRFYRSGTLIEF